MCEIIAAAPPRPPPHNHPQVNNTNTNATRKHASTHQERAGDGLEGEGLGVLDQAAQHAHGRGQDGPPDGVRPREAVKRPEAVAEPAGLAVSTAAAGVSPFQHAVGGGGGGVEEGGGPGLLV